MNFKPRTDRETKKPPVKKRAKKITPEYLHNSGLYYLQRFATSRANFEAVMMRKVMKSLMAHPEQDAENCRNLVNALADKFERTGLLDDKTYSQAAVRSLRQSGKSKRFIEQKLRHKGLKGEIIAHNIQEYDSHLEEQDGDLFSALILSRRKKIGPFSINESVNNEKHTAQLARAGFSYGIIQKIFMMDRSSAEEILDRLKIR